MSSTREIDAKLQVALIPVDVNPTSIYLQRSHLEDQKNLIQKRVQSTRSSHSTVTKISICFFLISLALLITGLVLENQKNCPTTTDTDDEDACESGTGSALATVGGILTALSFLGCCSRICSSKPKRTYSLLDDHEKKDLKDYIGDQKYNEDTDLAVVYDDIEKQLQATQYSTTRKL